MTCLQCNVVLLHSLNISLPDALLSIIDDPSQARDTQQTGASQPDAVDSVLHSDSQGTTAATVNLSNASKRMDEVDEQTVAAGDPGFAASCNPDDQLQFEDVEWEIADDGVADYGVFEIVKSDERADHKSQPSSEKRRVPQSIRKAVSEALRCAYCACLPSAQR